MTRRAAPGTGASTVAREFSSLVLARRLRQLAGPLSGARLCIAFSGGADSTALLAAAAALRGRHRCQVRALHVNHHLQPAATAMAAAAQATARRLAVPCQVVDAPVAVGRGVSPEAAARTVRYAALRSRLRAGEWLLLAQHQDDQVEALLLQLLRGAGVAGLAAMPAAAGPMLRPLLDTTRAQLLAYLRRKSLDWSDDPSNANERFGRNFLRLRVLPLLRERWPGLGVTISRSAALAAEARALLGERAAAQLQDAHVGAELSVCALRRLPLADRRNALRYWLELRGLPMPDQSRLQEIAGPMLRARADAQPCVRWPGGLVRRHGGLLNAALAPPGAAGAAGPVETGGPVRAPRVRLWNWLREPQLSLPDGAALELRSDPHGSLSRSALPATVRVVFRSADGTVAGRLGGRGLKRRLKSVSVQPWRRGTVPLIYAGRRLLAVGDCWQARELTTSVGAGAGARCRLHWRGGSASII